MVLIRRFFVAVAGGYHDAIRTEARDKIEEVLQLFWGVTFEDGGIGGDAKTGCFGGLNRLDRNIKGAVAAHQFIVALPQTVQMHAKCKIGRGGKLRQGGLEPQRIGAQVDKFFPRHQARGNLIDLRV